MLVGSRLTHRTKTDCARLNCEHEFVDMSASATQKLHETKEQLKTFFVSLIHPWKISRDLRRIDTVTLSLSSRCLHGLMERCEPGTLQHAHGRGHLGGTETRHIYKRIKNTLS